MSAQSFRCSIHLSESTYRGDRDERLTMFTVSGESPHTVEDAVDHAITDMLRLNPELGGALIRVAKREADNAK